MAFMNFVEYFFEEGEVMAIEQRIVALQEAEHVKGARSALQFTTRDEIGENELQFLHFRAREVAGDLVETFLELQFSSHRLLRS